MNGETCVDAELEKRRARRRDKMKDLGYSVTVDEDKVEAVVHSTGFSYSDIDGKNGLPKPWQLMKLLESARVFVGYWPLDASGRVFRDMERLTKDSMTFLISSVFDINEEVYDSTISKRPLDIKLQGGYIGTTSYNSIATAFTPAGQQLLSNTNQVVYIDTKSRRPKPLPDWWKKKYAESAKPFKALKFAHPTKPEGGNSYQLRVRRSDIDGNNHTNWSSYVRFSLDALYDFAKQGTLRSFHDFDDRHLKRMELTYSGESHDGDLLDVFAWESPETENRLHIHIDKNDTQVFQGTFDYYEQETHCST